MKKLLLSFLIPFSIFAMNRQLTQRKNHPDTKIKNVKALSMKREKVICLKCIDGLRNYLDDCSQDFDDLGCPHGCVDGVFLCISASCGILSGICLSELAHILDNYLQNHSHSD